MKKVKLLLILALAHLIPLVSLAQNQKSELLDSLLNDGKFRRYYKDYTRGNPKSVIVYGRVMDGKNGPLIGASVNVLKPKVRREDVRDWDEYGKLASGSTTDINGFFALRVPQGAVIEFSYWGFLAQTFYAGKKDEMLIVDLAWVGLFRHGKWDTKLGDDVYRFYPQKEK